MFATRTLLKTRLPQTVSKRNMSGWLNKNFYVEENAGIREASYRKWNFNPRNLSQYFFYLVLPSVLYVSYYIQEQKRKDALIGKSDRDYGILP